MDFGESGIFRGSSGNEFGFLRNCECMTVSKSMIVAYVLS